MIFRSPKSSLGGLVAIVGAALIWTGRVEEGATLIGIACALTGVVARDSDVTSEDACAEPKKSTRAPARRPRTTPRL